MTTISITSSDRNSSTAFGANHYVSTSYHQVQYNQDTITIEHNGFMYSPDDGGARACFITITYNGKTYDNLDSKGLTDRDYCRFGYLISNEEGYRKWLSNPIGPGRHKRVISTDIRINPYDGVLEWVMVEGSDRGENDHLFRFCPTS